jgi:hypothetical protein
MKKQKRFKPLSPPAGGETGPDSSLAFETFLYRNFLIVKPATALSSTIVASHTSTAVTLLNFSKYKQQNDKR